MVKPAGPVNSTVPLLKANTAPAAGFSVPTDTRPPFTATVRN
jgi:hypothetical protein